MSVAPVWAATDNLLDSVICAPNPFSLSRDFRDTLKYYLSDAAALDLEIYTPAGELVWSKNVSATATDAQPNILHTDIFWDGTNNKGQKVKFGGYLFKMIATPPHGGSQQSATFKIGVLP
jgi:hypothetical protein